MTTELEEEFELEERDSPQPDDELEVVMDDETLEDSSLTSSEQTSTRKITRGILKMDVPILEEEDTPPRVMTDKEMKKAMKANLINHSVLRGEERRGEFSPEEPSLWETCRKSSPMSVKAMGLVLLTAMVLLIIIYAFLSH